MEITGGEEEGFVREWAPCSHMLGLIPPRVQTGLFSSELNLTCIDAVSEFIALGTNIGLVYWYDRKKGNIQRLRCESTSSPITYVKIVNTVDYMVGAGNTAGQVTVFQIPKAHPDNVPDTFKPKVAPKVERYTVGDLHKSAVTAIEWSKNGMRLFSGDKNGVIIMTEIDFYMHLCKSMELVNEGHEIVQLSYHQNTLLVCSLYRSIVCERRDHKWNVTQVGKKDRKSLCAVGGVIVHSYSGRGEAGAVYCARPGLRLWKGDLRGEVLHTLLLKDAILNPLTIAELLNPALKKHSLTEEEHNFGPLYVYREEFLVTHDDKVLFILDPRTLTAVAVVDQLRRILSVSVNKDEIFILEGPRAVVRLGHAPEAGSLHPGDTANTMTKSLTTSIQNAMNTFKDLTIEQTVPFISSVLEQPISMFTKNEVLETDSIINAEECFELPPIKTLPADIAENVLESIVNEFNGHFSQSEEIKNLRSEELEKKFKLYDSIMERKIDGELIHSSRSRKVESGKCTPRNVTPVRNGPGPLTPSRKPHDNFSYNSSCVMDSSIYSTLPQESDDVLEKEIEEQEKILAKMLNLESLSIKPSKPVAKEQQNHKEDLKEKQNNKDDIKEKQNNKEDLIEKQNNKEDLQENPSNTEEQKPVSIVKKDVQLEQRKKEPIPVLKVDPDLVPKLVELPNNWNLSNLELRLDQFNGVNYTTMTSPDDQIEKEWEFV